MAVCTSPVSTQVVDPPTLKMNGNSIQDGGKKSITVSRKVYSSTDLLGCKKENFPIDVESGGDGEGAVRKDSILKLIFAE